MFQALGSTIFGPRSSMDGDDGDRKHYANVHSERVSSRSGKSKGLSSRGSNGGNKGGEARDQGRMIDNLQNDLLVKESIINADSSFGSPGG